MVGEACHPWRRVLRPWVSLQICGRWEECVNTGRKQKVRPGQKYLWPLWEVHIQPFLLEWAWSTASADITKLRYVLDISWCKRRYRFKRQRYQSSWKQYSEKCEQSSGQHRPAAESMGTATARSGVGFQGIPLIELVCLLRDSVENMPIFSICETNRNLSQFGLCTSGTEICLQMRYLFFVCRISVLNNYYVHPVHDKLWM